MRFELPDEQRSLTIGTSAIETEDHAQGVRAVQIVKQVPLACFLQGYTTLASIGKVEQLLGRSRHKQTTESVYAIPATEEATEWAIDHLSGLETQYNGKSTNQLAALLAEGLAFTDLRQAYKHAHAPDTLKGTEDWFSKSLDQQRATVKAVAELRAAASQFTPVQQLVDWLARYREFVPASELDEHLQQACYYQEEGRKTYMGLGQTQQSLVISAGDEGTLLLFGHTEDGWAMTKVHAESQEEKRFKSVRRYPLGNQKVTQVKEPEEAYAWASQQAMEHGDLTLIFSSNSKETNYVNKSRILTFASLSPLERTIGHFCASGVEEENFQSQKGYSLGTKKVLTERAKQLGIKGHSSMNVDDLRLAVAQAVIENNQFSQIFSTEEGFYVEKLGQSFQQKLTLPEGADTDNDAFEYLICATTGEGLAHPELAPQPTRLKQYHPWHRGFSPLNPFTPPNQ